MNIKKRTYKQDKAHSNGYTASSSYSASIEAKQKKQKEIKWSRQVKYTNWSE